MRWVVHTYFDISYKSVNHTDAMGDGDDLLVMFLALYAQQG